MARGPRDRGEFEEEQLEEINEEEADDEVADGEDEAELDSDEDEAELEDDDDEDEDESDSDEDSDGQPRKRRKPFIPPPPRELPQRTTRGLRTGEVAAVADDQADEEFWNQEFFAEEERDEEYETESEPEDRFDADFMESEDEEEDDEEAAEQEAQAREKRKKVLKPPGYKRPPPAKKKQPAKTEGGAEAEEGAEAVPKKARRTSVEVAAAMLPAERTVKVRDSTRQKVQVAEEERMIQEAMKPRRVSRPSVHRQLTQEELLAEAARTEIENTRSLQMMVAIEEETKKKAHVQRGKYVGPMLRLHSVKVEDEERTTLEVRNMQTPANLLPQTAPPPPQKPVCVITGQPAKYRDPQTGLAYADKAAFQELQRRKQMAAVARQQQVAAAALAQQQRYMYQAAMAPQMGF